MLEQMTFAYFILIVSSTKHTSLEKAKELKIINSLALNDIVLVHKVYYNSYYSFCGIKVQNMLQADRMRHAFINSMYYYDSVLSCKSNLTEIIRYLRVSPARIEQPSKVVLDKAHS